MTKLDVGQIWKMAYDELSKAIKVKLTDAEIAIELDHADGDSVSAHPARLAVSALGVTDSDTLIVPPLDASSVNRLEIITEVKSGSTNGSIKVQSSPADSGDLWFDEHTISSPSGISRIRINDLVIRRIRVIKETSLDSAELDIHLVGKS